ncbi:MAG: hypothetical protein QOK02_2461 [Mycobacterium sp.]|nr:hypothetical protein [Mycobacterium sp.]
MQPYLLDEQAEIATVIEWVEPASHDEELVVYLTDLPRRDGTRPVIADISIEHNFGLISIASIGGLFVGRQVQAVVESIVSELEHASEHRKDFTKLARTEHQGHVRYAAPQAFARLRLLSGMVYANRPWRLSVTTVLATAAMVVWLMVNHRLWEHPDSPSERDRAALYNTSTVITLTIGVVVLHATSFVLLILTALWTLPPQMLEQTLGHPVGLADYPRLAWLVAAVATLGGALGSGLEDDRVVREAAYGVRQRQRFNNSKRPVGGATTRRELAAFSWSSRRDVNGPAFLNKQLTSPVVATAAHQVVPKYSWICRMAMDPSPTADETRFTEPLRTSPTANTPGWLVSSIIG